MISKTKHKLTANVKTEKICTVCDKVYLGTAVQKTCSDGCRKVKYQGYSKEWAEKHPGSMTKYNKTRKEKNPTVWRDKRRKERMEIITTLGGECIVCGNSNPLHLHADYIPTMVGKKRRHPCHKRWVLEHRADFRILCANHHYELTLSGKIEGTDIVATINNPKSQYYEVDQIED